MMWGMLSAWHSAWHQQASINVNPVPQPLLLMHWLKAAHQMARAVWRGVLDVLVWYLGERKWVRAAGKMLLQCRFLRNWSQLLRIRWAALGTLAFVGVVPVGGRLMSHLHKEHSVMFVCCLFFFEWRATKRGLIFLGWTSCLSAASHLEWTLFMMGSTSFSVRCHCGHDSWDLFFPWKWFQARPCFFRLSPTCSQMTQKCVTARHGSAQVLSVCPTHPGKSWLVGSWLLECKFDIKREYIHKQINNKWGNNLVI